jgi:hypothetical protein
MIDYQHGGVWLNRADLLLVASLAAFISGIYMLVFSFYADWTVPAVIGLGLIFWGVVFALVKEESSVKKSLVDATVISATSALSEMTKELSLKGETVHLPPQYLINPEDNLVCILKDENSKLPTIAEVRAQEAKTLPFDIGNAVVMVPTGDELTRLLERALKTNLAQLNMKEIRKRLPQAVVERLQMAEKMEIEVQDESIRVRMANPFLGRRHWKEASVQDFVKPLENPLSSALACAFAKGSARAVVTTNWHMQADAEIVEITYKFLETPAIG